MTPNRVKGTFVSSKKPFEATPLDHAIVRLLPDEGAKVGKYLWDARTTKQLLVLLDSEGLSPDMIGGRLRLMRAYELVLDVPLISNGRGWQRTKAGSDMVGGQSD